MASPVHRLIHNILPVAAAADVTDEFLSAHRQPPQFDSFLLLVAISHHLSAIVHVHVHVTSISINPTDHPCPADAPPPTVTIHYYTHKNSLGLGYAVTVTAMEAEESVLQCCLSNQDFHSSLYREWMDHDVPCPIIPIGCTLVTATYWCSNGNAEASIIPGKPKSPFGFNVVIQCPGLAYSSSIDDGLTVVVQERDFHFEAPGMQQRPSPE
eukprot:scaffold37489_cov65-Attheya_sp.AAC.1